RGRKRGSISAEPSRKQASCEFALPLEDDDQQGCTVHARRNRLAQVGILHCATCVIHYQCNEFIVARGHDTKMLLLCPPDLLGRDLGYIRASNSQIEPL